MFVGDRTTASTSLAGTAAVGFSAELKSYLTPIVDFPNMLHILWGFVPAR